MLLLLQTKNPWPIPALCFCCRLVHCNSSTNTGCYCFAISWYLQSLSWQFSFSSIKEVFHFQDVLYSRANLGLSESEAACMQYASDNEGRSAPCLSGSVTYSLNWCSGPPVFTISMCVFPMLHLCLPPRWNLFVVLPDARPGWTMYKRGNGGGDNISRLLPLVNTQHSNSWTTQNKMKLFKWEFPFTSTSTYRFL